MDNKVSLMRMGGARLLGALDAAALAIDYARESAAEAVQKEIDNLLDAIEALEVLTRQVHGLPESDDEWQYQIEVANGDDDGGNQESGEVSNLPESTE